MCPNKITPHLHCRYLLLIVACFCCLLIVYMLPSVSKLSALHQLLPAGSTFKWLGDIDGRTQKQSYPRSGAKSDQLEFGWCINMKVNVYSK